MSEAKGMEIIMRKINKAIVALDYCESDLHQICECLDAKESIFCSSGDSEIIMKNLADAEVAILTRPVKNINNVISPNMKWIHCDAAGLDMMYTPELSRRDGLTVTSASGRSSKALSEHVIMFMLALTYQLTKVQKKRIDHQWTMPFLNQSSALVGKTVGILGTGSIGKEVAVRCKAFEMNVLGYNKGNTTVIDGFDHIFTGPDGLQKILTECDYLVCTLPLTDETYHLLNRDRFLQMKSSAYLINISRGAVIDEKELLECLDEGIIAGAGLDTFETEPLPANSAI